MTTVFQEVLYSFCVQYFIVINTSKLPALMLLFEQFYSLEAVI